MENSGLTEINPNTTITASMEISDASAMVYTDPPLSGAVVVRVVREH